MLTTVIAKITQKHYIPDLILNLSHGLFQLFFFQTLSNQQHCTVGKLSHSAWKMCPESLLTFVVEALFFQPSRNSLFVIYDEEVKEI